MAADRLLAASWTHAGAGAETGVVVWRVESLAPARVAKEHHGRFFTGDCYIVLLTWTHAKASCSSAGADGGGGSEPMCNEVFFWLGANSTLDDQGAAAIMAVELDDCLDGRSVLRRETQMHETASFFATFSGVLEYLDGSAAEGTSYASVDQLPETGRLSKLDGTRQCRVTNCAVASSSLHAGHVFVLELATGVIQWNGQLSSKQQRGKGAHVSRRRSALRSSTAGSSMPEHAVVQQGQAQQAGSPVEQFWHALGVEEAAVEIATAPARPAAAARPSVSSSVASTQLWRLGEVQTPDGKRKLQVSEILDRPLLRSMLDPSDAFVVAETSELWIWVGSQKSRAERSKSMLYAQSFLQGKTLPSATPIARVVQGAEPMLFTSRFADWHLPAELSTAELLPGSEAMAALAAGRAAAAARLGSSSATGGAPNTELRVWRVAGGETAEVATEMHGLFHRGDAYVIMFVYDDEARKRRAIIYQWHGREASADEKAQAALLALELANKAHGVVPAHERLVQDLEPPHFVALFSGKMVVRDGGHAIKTISGRRHSIDTRDHDGVALFRVIASDAQTVRAVQVAESATSLNSAESFVLQRPGALHVWSGSSSSAEERLHARSVAAAIASRLQLSAANHHSCDGVAGALCTPVAGRAAIAAAAAAGTVPPTGLSGSQASDVAEIDDEGMVLAVVMSCDERSMPDGVHGDKLGTYLPHSDRTNGRPVFRRESNPNFMLWWSGGRWWLGKREELGLNRGWIKVESDAQRPPPADWMVYSSKAKAWKPAAGVSM